MDKPDALIEDSNWNDWRWQIANSVTTPEALRCLTGVQIDAESSRPVMARYPMQITPFYATLIQKPDNHLDPVRIQCVPQPREVEHFQASEASRDPFAETRQMPVTGLIHRFADRALVIATANCAVRCRHCTRKNTLDDMNVEPTHDYFRPMIKYVESKTQIREVIISGGDPLLLRDDALAKIIERLDRMPHLERLRIHTRLPVVLPQRITASLLALLGRRRAEIVVVVHCNHAQELDTETHRAFTALRNSGLWLLNQAVLLQGVNDTLAAQVDLHSTLFAQGVLPYYLHLPDPIAGTQHFFVDEPAGQALHREMQSKLPGYLVPRLVKEIAGEPNKIIVSSKN